MDANHYRFAGTWHLPAPAGQVYAVLRDAEGYQRWWPQIRSARRLDEDSGELVMRSVLPFDLVITAYDGREDPGAGTLQAAIGRDLEGWFRWTVRAAGPGCTVRYEQDVVVRKPLLRRLAPVGRPALRANHAWAMRAARRGLTRALTAPESGCPPQTPSGE